MFNTLEEVQAKYPIGINKDFNSVDGYIYDGQYWYPAEFICDVWLPIEEEENIV